jgi:hypothetical protein
LRKSIPVAIPVRYRNALFRKGGASTGIESASPQMSILFMTQAIKEKTNKLSWHTEQRTVSDLIPNSENPRKMSEKQAEELKKSLEKFNLAEIPAINTDNKIVAGHMRVATLQLLGRGDEVIDVRVPNRKLTDKEYREYLLRSNQNRGDWDWDILANTFAWSIISSKLATSGWLFS